MPPKFSARQQAQMAVLEPMPRRFELVARMIEEMASLRADESLQRKLVRNLDELKSQASSIGQPALAEAAGVMSMLARRTGGLQMRIRGLREGMVSLKINYEGALRAATLSEEAGDEPE
jgi:hypothetical protein